MIKSSQSIDALKRELDFLELEERLELVQIASAAAASAACSVVNNGCDNSGGGGGCGCPPPDSTKQN